MILVQTGCTCHIISVYIEMSTLKFMDQGDQQMPDHDVDC